MLFHSNFYTILETNSSEEQVSFRININPKHEIFDGHFPGNPVTPSVVQLELIKELLMETSGSKVALISLNSAKYLAILNPTKTPELTVTLTLKQLDNNQIRVSGQFHHESETFMKCVGTYQLQ